MKNKSINILGIGFLFFILMGFLAASHLAVTSAWAEEEIVMLGVFPLSGPYADEARDQNRGTELALEEVGYKVLGKKIRYVLRDTELKAGVGVRRAKDVIESQGAKFMVGAASSSVALALSQLATSKNVVYLTHTGADEITGTKCRKYTFRWSGPTYTITRGVILPLIQKYPDAKRWYTITTKYVFGESLLNNAKEIFKEHGIKHVGNDYHPIGESEYSTFLTKAAASKADIILLLNFGGDATKAIKQAHNYGLKKSAKIVLAWGSGVTQFRALGNEALEDVYFGLQYWHGINSPVTKRLNTTYKQKYEDFSDYSVAGSYIIMKILLDAIEKAGTTDADAVIKTLEGYTFQGPTGEESVRAGDHQVIKKVYLAKGKTKLQMKYDADFIEIVDKSAFFIPLEQNPCKF